MVVHLKITGEMASHNDQETPPPNGPRLSIIPALGLSMDGGWITINCPKYHLLTEYRTFYDGYTCSHCTGTFPRNTTLRGCRKCDYDLCRKCDALGLGTPTKPGDTPVSFPPINDSNLDTLNSDGNGIKGDDDEEVSRLTKEKQDETIEAQARVEADKKYFAQRKAGPAPQAKKKIGEGGEEELITFVEDGLNRPNLRPKPVLGSRRPKKVVKASKCTDLIGRHLIKLGNCNLRNNNNKEEEEEEARRNGVGVNTCFLQCLENDAISTSLLISMGLSSLPHFASLCRATCIASRDPDWRRMTEALSEEYGLLVVSLIPEHLSCQKNQQFSWKQTFANLYKERNIKWGFKSIEEEKKIKKIKKVSKNVKIKTNDFKMKVMVRLRPSNDDQDEEEEASIFLPLHQRIQLEKLGHDTQLEKEVHANMTNNAKTFEQQKEERDGNKTEDTHEQPLLDTERAELMNAEAEEGEAVEQHRKTRAHSKIVNVEDERILMNVAGSGIRYFEFDAVLGETLSQEKAYLRSGLPVLEALLQGYSTCLLVYGQTGSGKTYTMFGGGQSLSSLLKQQPYSDTMDKTVGIIPRLLLDLMGVLDLMKKSVSATVTMNYVEIYNDQVTDLFSGNEISLYRIGQGAAAEEHRTLNAELDLQDNYLLRNASDLVVENAYEVLEAIAKGEENKHTAATKMNDRSSRAHTIFMVEVTQRFHGFVKKSRMHLVDLGGSEQVKRSGVSGSGLSEAIDINSSLMVLGKVIDALVNHSKHVPYYESKLTSLLQPALGGKARTTVLITASPDGVNGDETVHSLRFGERCREVVSKDSGSLNNHTANMSQVLNDLTKAIKQSESLIEELILKGGKEQAELDLQGLAQGQALESLTKAGSGGRGYTVVEDVAGIYLSEVEKLKLLKKRYKEIIGGGSTVATSSH